LFNDIPDTCVGYMKMTVVGNKLQRMRKELVAAYFKVISWRLSGGKDENTNNIIFHLYLSSWYILPKNESVPYDGMFNITRLFFFFTC